jgi:hypothetical protein
MVAAFRAASCTATGPDGTWLPGGASSSGAGALTLLPGADLDALTAVWHGSPHWRDT